MQQIHYTESKCIQLAIRRNYSYVFYLYKEPDCSISQYTHEVLVGICRKLEVMKKILQILHKYLPGIAQDAIITSIFIFTNMHNHNISFSQKYSGVYL